jgi:hypothetical protein
MNILRKTKKVLNEDQERTTKSELDTKDVNPFKIKKEDVFIDPNDPNRSPEEQLKHRRNWNRRRNYRKKKARKEQIDVAVETLLKAQKKMLQDAKKKGKKRVTQGQEPQVYQVPPENY